MPCHLYFCRFFSWADAKAGKDLPFYHFEVNPKTVLMVNDVRYIEDTGIIRHRSYTPGLSWQGGRTEMSSKREQRIRREGRFLGIMGIEQLKSKIEEQKAVYQALKAGDDSTVCYQGFQNGEWGTADKNYTNRLRLAYYLLYCHIEDEDAVVHLFQEELKDRERNSFQGIGSTLEILTHLIRKYNGNGKYADLLTRAKNANFDCACGYSPDNEMEDELSDNSLFDCIWLCQEMKYRDVMGGLVDAWKKTITEWSDSNYRALIGFNKFLERDTENERLYQEQLEKLLAEKNSCARDLIFAYKELIFHFLHMGKDEKALALCKRVIETTNYEQIRTLRLFKDILEACFEITQKHTEEAEDLWNWAKAEFQKVPQSSRYGNLYKKGIAAANAMDDPFGKQLEQEYKNFLASVQW